MHARAVFSGRLVIHFGMPMTPEVREKWTEAWHEARRKKDERRAENRAKWAGRRDWSDDNAHKLELGTGLDEGTHPDGSESLRKLRAIMANTNIQLHRRLDAAEILVSFEIAP